MRILRDLPQPRVIGPPITVLTIVIVLIAIIMAAIW